MRTKTSRYTTQEDSTKGRRKTGKLIKSNVFEVIVLGIFIKRKKN